MTNYSEMELPELLKAYNESVEIALGLGVTLYKPRTEFKDKEQALAFINTVESSIKAAESSAAEVLTNQKAEKKSAKVQQNDGVIAPKKKKSKKVKKVLAKSKDSATVSPSAEQANEADQPGENEMANRKATSKKSTAKARKGVAKTAKTSSRGRTPRADDDAKIVKGKANEFREGTDRHNQYMLAIKSGNVGKYLKAGGDRNFLNWYRRNDYVKVG